MTRKENGSELEAKNAESNPVSPVPAPPVPASDVETERRVNKMLEELEQLGTVPVPEVPPAPPLYVRDLSGKMRLNVKRTAPKPELASGTPAVPLPPPSAEDLAAAEAEKQRIAKIDEDYAEVQKRYNRPLQPWERDMPRHQVQSKIAYDNRIIHDYQEAHGLLPKVGTVPHFDVEELKRENAAVQREYQQEYNYQRSGGQITPPSSLLPDYIIARRFKKGGE